MIGAEVRRGRNVGSSEGDTTVGGPGGIRAVPMRALFFIVASPSPAGRFSGGQNGPTGLLIVAAEPELEPFGECMRAKSSRSMLTVCPLRSPSICKPLPCVSSTLGEGEGNTMISRLPWLRLREWFVMMFASCGDVEFNGGGLSAVDAVVVRVSTRDVTVLCSPGRGSFLGLTLFLEAMGGARIHKTLDGVEGLNGVKGAWSEAPFIHAFMCFLPSAWFKVLAVALALL